MGDTASVQDLLGVLGDSAGALLGLGRAEHKIMMQDWLVGWLAFWPWVPPFWRALNSTLSMPLDSFSKQEPPIQPGLVLGDPQQPTGQLDTTK